MNALSKSCGVSRQTIKNLADRFGLDTRSVAEATKLTKNRGENHFLYGKTKNNCSIARAHSERMKLDNPIKNVEARNKRAVTISRTFSKNLLPQEKAFKKILSKYGVIFETQKAVGRFNLDFFCSEFVFSYRNRFNLEVGKNS